MRLRAQILRGVFDRLKRRDSFRHAACSKRTTGCAGGLDCSVIARNGERHAEEGAPEKENARVKPDILRNAAERGSGERGDESLSFPAVPLFGSGAHRAAQPHENAEEKEPVKVDPNKSPEDMTVDELQQAILAKMAGNGLVTDQMKKTVYDNIWHDSLVNWLKSFHLSLIHI